MYRADNRNEYHLECKGLTAREFGSLNTKLVRTFNLPRDRFRNPFPLTFEPIDVHTIILAIAASRLGVYAGKKVIDVISEVVKAHLMPSKARIKSVTIRNGSGKVIRTVRTTQTKK
jgi:hypothetical protein